ncbi:uncharacterized protein LOC131989931 isoform X2 [Centropristis striata]|uniref:uncharacterized protein LOC131989931 isoform X2 n=1 Tax=Centropristis striata TaxID=184440 RepID=UPI0027E0209F|nr:uncharacterized protein LOC131989931 isoform X2 [Centropristis striata]
MPIYGDDTEYPEIPMYQRVMGMGMFEARPGFQRVVRIGLVANIGYNDDDEEDTERHNYGTDNWAHGHNNFHGYSRVSDNSSGRGLSGNRTRPSTNIYKLPLHYYASSCEIPCPPSEKVQAKESDSERRERLLEEEKRVKEKAEKKRIKKQNRKERKRLEKLEREKQNPVKHIEGKDNAQAESKNNFSADKQSASAKDTDSSDSSEDEVSDEDSDTKNDSDNSEELDMTSTFVSKAALIARRKLDQKPRPEKKDKKKISVKEEPKTVPDKPIEDPEVEKKDSAAPRSPTFEDNVKISTELAVIGNRFASAGDFNMAVKYFTDAIRYNPTEFKLFGNRSFCFEKMLQCGFTREQSSNALIIHGTVKKALEVLSKLNNQPGAIQNGTLQPAQVANVTGVSPVLSANTIPPHPHSHDAPKTAFINKPLGPVQNMSNVQSQPKPLPNPAMKSSYKDAPTPQELFPVWVGNLVGQLNESLITNMFNKVGDVYSVKLLIAKRCAFVNFTKQEDCDEAIRRLHGFELNGMKIAVRYPDRIPSGMGISRAALRADGLQDENMLQNEYVDGRNAVGGRRPFRPYRHMADTRGNHKY